jgi:6-phosphogluconolactonase
MQKLLLVALFFPMLVFGQNPTDLLLFVGNYTPNNEPGIEVFNFDEATGTAKAVAKIKDENPSFLTVSANREVLFTVNENDFGEVSSYRISTKGMLKPIGRKLTGGQYPCHLSLDPSGKWLLAGNYGDGTISCFPVTGDGTINTIKKFMGHEGVGPDKKRQEGPHVHQITFAADGKSFFATDLGIDKVMIWSFDPTTAAMAMIDSISVAPGSGPRHIVQKGAFIYVLQELTSSISVYKKMEGSSYHYIHTVSTSSTGYTGPFQSAEIAISPDGKYLLASNRQAENSIASFKIKRSGRLKALSYTKLSVKTPRSFTFSPNGQWVLVAGQDSGNIEVYGYKKGKLTATGTIIPSQHPVCLLFSRAPVN